jgi:hypothetical protein
MKVEFDGKFVTRAYYEVNSQHCSSLFVTTTERWPYYVTEGSDDYMTLKYYNEDISSEDEEDYGSLGYATLKAETAEDLLVLGRVRFKNQNKDQLWLVFLSSNVLGFE